jgi:hypothetical protein
VKYLGAKHGRKKYRKNEWAFELTFSADFDPDTPTLLFLDEPRPVLERFVQKKGTEGSQLPIELVRDSGILMGFFEHASWDYILQENFRRTASCAYLSDSGREIKLLGQLLGESPEDARNATFASMSHNIPLFADIRLETLVSVRQQDGDAFAAYRGALNEAAREANQQGITPARSREIYSDIIVPKLVALERKYEVLRGRFKTDVLLDIGVPIAALVIGALSAGSHPFAANVLETIGSLDLVRSAGRHLKSARGSESSMDTVKSDPLYFLLRMKREHDKSCANESRYVRLYGHITECPAPQA